jgi:putative restriction endonuclease
VTGTDEFVARARTSQGRRASTTRTRHFQAHFRRAVLAAYRHRCGICAIGEKPVLDGAHLVADREEPGEPRVSNGLSLCALHHRAFDRDLVGITPDFAIYVFRDRLEYPDEDEGAILTRFDGDRLRLPRDENLHPDRELVDWRWQAALEG